MRIADGVEALALDIVSRGGRSAVFPTLFWDGDGAVLVDAGFPGMGGAVRAAVEKAGVPFDDLRTVVFTHQDIDHTGGLPELLQAGGRFRVLCGELEKPYLTGEKPLVKSDPKEAAKMLAGQPEAVVRDFVRSALNAPKIHVDEALADGRELALCGGLLVLHTPGHTPGHIALYHRPSKTLVAGDSLTARDGVLNGPRPAATQNLELALRSVRKYFNLDIKTVVCYHGGVCRGDVRASLAAIEQGR